MNKLALSLLLGAALLGPGCKKSNPAPSAAAPPFAAIPETEIVGRYKWIEGGAEKGEAMLYPDHTCTNHRGEKKPGYRWALEPEGLLFIWQKGHNFFGKFISPGIYEGQRDGVPVRIEKQ